MSYVESRPGESFESLMRRFKKACEKAGIQADAKKHEYYEKPSVARKHKAAEARKRKAKEHRKSDDYSKKSNQNFRFNRDRTQKIPLPPPRRSQDNRKPYYKPAPKTLNKGN